MNEDQQNPQTQTPAQTQVTMPEPVTAPAQNATVPPVQAQPPQPDYDTTTQTLIPTKNMPALLSYYFGIFGLIPFLGFPLAIAAIVMGFIGLNQYKRNPTPGAKGHAIAGIILGIIPCVFALLLFVLVAIA